MFFLFFPLPFSVNSVPSALASVKNKISLTMRSPPCLASVPSPAALAPLFSCQGWGMPLLPISGYPLLLPCSSPCPAWPGVAAGGEGMRPGLGEGATSGCVGLTSRVCTWVFVGVGARPGRARWCVKVSPGAQMGAPWDRRRSGCWVRCRLPAGR